MKDTLMIDITGHCARCDGKHEGLVFRRMIGEPVEAIDGIYRYWAMCPRTNQPIVLMCDEDMNPHPKLLEAQQRAIKSKALIVAISRRLSDTGLEEWKKDIMGGAQALAREFLEERDKLKARIQKCKKGHEYLASSHEYPCPICQLEEYGPDYVDQLQQTIDEKNVEILHMKGVMTNFHDDHVYGTKGTEGWLRPCCQVDEREPHKEDCEVGKVIGNNKPRHRLEEEDDGHEVGELTPENATVAWNGDEPPPGVDPGGSIGPLLGQLPDSGEGDEEPGSAGAEGKTQANQMGDEGEPEGDV